MDILDQRCVQAAKDGNLVVFVGAGASCIPPTSLPMWSDINAAVLRGLHQRSAGSSDAPIVTNEVLQELSDHISNEIAHHRMPPEYFSEVLVNRLGSYYFNVLSVLDSDVGNPVHKTIAWLARAKCLTAVVTTNFDMCIESAMRKVGVTPIVWKVSTDFDVNKLIAMKANGELNSGDKCIILKVHGSADAPTSVIDTLSQRSIGLANVICECLAHLVKQSPWLFLGYSGADLAAVPNYLELRANADDAVGWAWLVRSNMTPNDAVVSLRDAYAGKGVIQLGELPAYLDPLINAINESIPGAAADILRIEQPSTSSSDALKTRINEWSAHLLPEEAIVAYADLLIAVSKSSEAVSLLETYANYCKNTYVDNATLSLRKRNAYCSILNALAKLHHSQGRIAEAQSYFSLVNEKLSVLTALEPSDVSSISLVITSDMLDMSESSDLFTLQACELSAKNCMDMGNMYRTAANDSNAYDNAYKMFQESIARYSRLPENARVIRGLAQCFMGLGDVQRARFDPSELRNVEDVIEQYDNVIRLIKKIGDVPMEAQALKNQGIVYKARADVGGLSAEEKNVFVEKAMNKYETALLVQHRIGDAVEQVKSLRGVADLFDKMGQPERALDMATQSRNLAVKVGYIAGEARALRVMADVCVSMKRYEDAIQYIQQSLSIVDGALDDKAGVARGRFVLAKIYAMVNQAQKAKDEAMVARDIFQELGETKSANKVIDFLNNFSQ